MPKKGPPWTVGFASSYAGNTWRAAGMDRLMNVLVPEAKKAGLIKDVIITQSDLKDAVQIQQIRQLVDQGVDIIFFCCSNPTALNRSIKYAYDKGVPVVSYDGFVTAPEALNGTPNIVEGGYLIAESVIKKMGGKGNVLMVSGIQGVDTSDDFDTGARKAIAEHPDIKLIGTVQGKWTDQVVQVEVQKFLATHPEAVDGVIVQAPEMGVIRALLQSGRKVPPLNMQGTFAAACYWREHPEIADIGYYMWPPASEMYFGWNVVLRVLEGQSPKLQTIARPALKFSIEDANAQLPKDCTTDDQRWLEPKAEDWFPASLANEVFARPSDPLAWKPAK
jgi:ribose transport system substrate-binding protein